MDDKSEPHPHSSRAWLCPNCGAVLGRVSQVDGLDRLLLRLESGHDALVLGYVAVPCKCGKGRAWRKGLAEHRVVDTYA